jgi:hypothetical protein
VRNVCILLVSACSLAVTTLAETPASRQLPQAQPGSFYSTQLAIPPGLGYPFEDCKLAGDSLPKSLTLDCQRLLLKGRVPAGIEKTYQISLFLADAQGNNRTYFLALRVSSKPEIVDLGDSQTAAAPKNEIAVQSGGTDKTSVPEPAATPDTTANPPKENQTHIPPSNSTDAGAATELQNAVAFLKPASIGLAIVPSKKTIPQSSAVAAQGTGNGGKPKDPPPGPFEHFGIVGLSGSAASSTTLQAKMFAQLYGDAPAPLFGMQSVMRGWGFLRIGSIAQTDTSLITSQGASAVTSASNLQVQQLVQSLEMGAGLEFPISRSQQYPYVSFIFGGGASTPLSTQEVQLSNQTFQVTPELQQFYASGTYAKYLSQFQTLCPSTDSSSDAGKTCYVAFYPQDRSRFFRNYALGVRAKFSAPTSAQQPNYFPFTFDATIGQNEYVTGGMMRGWVFHVGGATPLPYANGLFLFGGMDFGVTGHGDNPGPLLFPTTSSMTPAPDSTNTINIVVPQPNRDRYLFGIGFDIAGVLQRHLQNDNKPK